MSEQYLNPTFSTGQIIVGKWKNSKYEIQGLLGEGANGKVYLVVNGKTIFAMKMGFTVLDHQSEVNALKALSKSRKESFLIEVDDFEHAGQSYPFYVMKYVEGLRAHKFLQRYGEDWIWLIGLNILERLRDIHQQGFIFGDLKVDNVIVSKFGRVELIDYGGVTRKGRSVKQFTEIYDRGYWTGGSRTADESYDLFSFALLCLQCVDSEQKLQEPSLPQVRDLSYLEAIVREIAIQPHIKVFIFKAIRGELHSSEQAVQQWKAMMRRNNGRKLKPIKATWIKGALAVSLLAFASAIYTVLQ